MGGEGVDAALQDRPPANRQQLLGFLRPEPLSAAAGGDDRCDMHGMNLRLYRSATGVRFRDANVRSRSAPFSRSAPARAKLAAPLGTMFANERADVHAAARRADRHPFPVAQPAF